MMFRAVFWVVLPCRMIVDRRFRGAYCLHYQGWISRGTEGSRLYRCRVARWTVVVGDDRLGTGQWQWAGGASSFMNRHLHSNTACKPDGLTDTEMIYFRNTWMETQSYLANPLTAGYVILRRSSSVHVGNQTRPFLWLVCGKRHTAAFKRLLFVTAMMYEGMSRSDVPYRRLLIC
jgi:hypothetical protein